MAFDVNKFRASFFTGGEPASAATFEARIFLPPAIMYLNEIARVMPLRVESTVLPGKALNVAERRTYGPTRKIAYGSSFEEVTMTFIVSSAMVEKSLVSIWHNLIHEANQGDVEYYDSYTSTVDIVQYDHKGNEVTKVTLIEAYPVSVSPIDLNWNEKNEYMRMQVTFAYRYWVDSAGEFTNSLNSIISTTAANIQFLNNVKELLKNGDIGGAISVALGAINVIDGIKKTLPNGVGKGISQVAEKVSSKVGSLSSNASSGASSAFSKATEAFKSIF